MAIVKNNMITKGLSGTIGGMLVFRNRGGQTIASSPPTKPTADPTEAQLRHRERFLQANQYATSQMADPLLKERYNEQARHRRKPSGYAVAVSDFFHAPDIINIDLAAYAGAVGNLIRIRADDDFDVKRVTVEIQRHDGTLVETGEAVRHSASSIVWVYTATIANGDRAGGNVVVTATDFAGNATTDTQAL